MKLASPYTCDYCGKRKGESNHWWLCYTQELQRGGSQFRLAPWDEADAQLDFVQHICGAACAAKALAAFMGAAPAKPAATEANPHES